MFRPYLTLALALTLTGCGANALQPKAQTPSGSLVAASAERTRAGTAALAVFERLPEGRPKGPRQVRAFEDPAPGPQLPTTIVKIRQIAAIAIADAGAAQDHKTRWGVTDKALDQIADVKLAGFGKRNVPVLLGRLASRGYGYMGLHPTYETRYLVQVPVLEYLRASSNEATLTAGSPLFSLGATMVDACTSWDQGLRVGISVLSVLEEHYSERDMRKACRALLEKAVQEPTKEQACQTIVSGLMELSRRAN